jgi:hypothetical protein
MIDRHYGHLARDGREHAIHVRYELSAGQRPRLDNGGRRVDAAGPRPPSAETTETRRTAIGAAPMVEGVGGHGLHVSAFLAACPGRYRSTDAGSSS